MSNSFFNSRNGFAQAFKWGHALIHSGMITRAFNSKPIWAQLQITERCNLQCGYCSEHKNGGIHVPYTTVTKWIQHCSMLGVKHIEFIGGEPLLHPDLLRFITMARELKISAGLTTNGFMLNKKLAADLIAGGINRLQLSIDCIEPNNVTRKALMLLRPQLELMSSMKIWVHVNSVLTEETLPQARELALNLFGLGVPVAFSPAHVHGQLQIGSASGSMIEFFDWLSIKKRQGHPVNMAQFLLNHIFLTLLRQSFRYG